MSGTSTPSVLLDKACRLINWLWSFLLDSGRSGPSELFLVFRTSPVVLEPVDQHLEGSVILKVEVEASRSDLDELFENFLFGHVS